MAIYKVSGSYEQFFEATIEADTEEIAKQIFYNNAGDMTVVDSNWLDVNIDYEFEDEEDLNAQGESIEYTMDDYDERFQVSV